MNLGEMRVDSAIEQKKGLHFILASVIIWSAVLVVHFLTTLNILAKNLLTFFFTAPLMPLAFMISKIIKVDFTNKNNPLTDLGVIFSANQILYLLIAMWIYNAVPEKMVMILAMIFGAHLLPYGWLYKSKSYIALSIIIPVAAFIIGVQFSTIFCSRIYDVPIEVFSLLLM